MGNACFLSAIKLIAGKKKINLPDDVAVDAEVDLGLAKGVHNLAAWLNVSLPGIDQHTAESVVEAASHACPYSLATSGNIEVAYRVTTSSAKETQHA